MRRSARRAGAVACMLAVAASVSAACGTTVPGAERAAKQPLGPQDDLQVPAATPTAAASTTPGATAAPASAPAPGPGGAPGGGNPVTPIAPPGSEVAGSTAPVSGHVSAPAGSTAPASGPGVTATTIALGFMYVSNGSQANAVVGGANFTTGDEHAVFEAMVASVNAHGGIAGRKIVPVYATLDPTSTQTIDTQEQAACQQLTVDHHVLLVLAAVPKGTFVQCVQNAGAAVIDDGGLTDEDASWFTRFPTYVEPSGLNLDRIAVNEVALLSAQGYFSGWNTATGTASPATPVKIGVITYSDPEYQAAVTRSLLPALARAGHPVDPGDVSYALNAQLDDQAGQLSADVASAELRMRTDNVTHVLFLEKGGLPALFFLNAAEGQHWHPRYGFTSQDAPEILLSGGDVQPDQMNGAMGIGWLPPSDLPYPSDDHGYANAPRFKDCLSIMTKAGQAPTSADSLGVAIGDCDAVWFVRDALADAGATTNIARYLAGVRALGNGFPDPVTIATSFGAGQHDGAAAAYAYIYSVSCTCWGYTGTPVPLR